MNNHLKEFVIAIPSYKRPELLRDQTLRLLKEYHIPQKKIYVFVANNEQSEIYRLVLKKQYPNINIVIGKPGLKEIRNFMPKYFKQGQYIFYLDDDMYALMECVGDNKKNNKLVRLRSLKNLINKGFRLCEKHKCALWGIYPVYNPYFMKTKNDNNYYSTDLKFIIGYGCGVINDHSCELRSIANKEDYERTIKYYLKYDKVIRFNNIVAKTKCYSEPGGLQSDGLKKRQEMEHKSAVYLINKYPKLVFPKKTKSEFAEIRLYDKR
tara:strand:+ start:4756 stop:5553 length:798 start_codon:yes stop_codon:yes gene_type:complete